MPAYNEFRIVTGGLGELVWRPSAELNERYADAPSSHPGGTLAAAAAIFAELAELMTLGLNLAEGADKTTERLRELMPQAPPQMFSLLDSVCAYIQEARAALLERFETEGWSVPPHAQELSAVGANPLRDEHIARFGSPVDRLLWGLLGASPETSRRL